MLEFHERFKTISFNFASFFREQILQVEWVRFHLFHLGQCVCSFSSKRFYPSLHQGCHFFRGSQRNIRLNWRMGKEKKIVNGFIINWSNNVHYRKQCNNSKKGRTGKQKIQQYFTSDGDSDENNKENNRLNSKVKVTALTSHYRVTNEKYFEKTRQQKKILMYVNATPTTRLNQYWCIKKGKNNNRLQNGFHFLSRWWPFIVQLQFGLHKKEETTDHTQERKDTLALDNGTGGIGQYCTNLVHVSSVHPINKNHMEMGRGWEDVKKKRKKKEWAWHANPPIGSTIHKYEIKYGQSNKQTKTLLYHTYIKNQRPNVKNKTCQKSVNLSEEKEKAIER